MEHILETSKTPAHFHVVAAHLFNRVILEVNGITCELVEIEFYHYSADHSDPFTHQSSEQWTMGKWYFHKQGQTYIENSYKGVDITFSCGGILLRTLLTPSGIIEGTSKVVDYLLERTGCSSVAELSGKADNLLKLYVKPEPTNQLPLRTAYPSPRVGLTLKKNPQLGKQFVMRLYRFSWHPASLKNGKLHFVLTLKYLYKMHDTDVKLLTGVRDRELGNYAELISKPRECDPGLKKISDIIEIFRQVYMV